MRIDDFLENVPKVSLVRHKGMIKVQIYFSREERKYFSTGIAVSEKNWRDGLVVGTRDAARINAQLLKKVDEMQRRLIALSANGEELSAYTLDNVLQKQKALRGSFLDYMAERIAERDIAYNTKRNHLKALRELQRFGGIVTFNSLTPANIYKFDQFLRRENKSRTQVTLHNIHKCVKVYINECCQLGIVKDNPYNQFRYDRGKHKERMPLTEDLITRVRDAELAGKYKKTRDLFVLMCYTGLSYVDMQALRREDIIEKGGKLYIRSTRTKSKEAFYTPILPAARMVLEKYDYKVPMISNQKMNKYLHEIECMLDIPIPMTCHVARHSFATLMLTYDVPIPVVAKMLGHSSTKTTEIYAKVLAENVEEKSIMVMDKLL